MKEITNSRILRHACFGLVVYLLITCMAAPFLYFKASSSCRVLYSAAYSLVMYPTDVCMRLAGLRCDEASFYRDILAAIILNSILGALLGIVTCARLNMIGRHRGFLSLAAIYGAALFIVISCIPLVVLSLQGPHGQGGTYFDLMVYMLITCPTQLVVEHVCSPSQKEVIEKAPFLVCIVVNSIIGAVLGSATGLVIRAIRNRLRLLP